jgi:hypothetical protein
MNISKHITISSITANIFILFAVFTTGNFVYQAFTSQDWTTALERSFFQFMAFLAVWIAMRASAKRDIL